MGASLLVIESLVLLMMYGVQQTLKCILNLRESGDIYVIFIYVFERFAYMDMCAYSCLVPIEARRRCHIP